MIRSKRTTKWNRVRGSVRKVKGFIREKNVETTKRIIDFPHFQRVRISPAAEYSGSTARFRSARSEERRVGQEYRRRRGGDQHENEETGHKESNRPDRKA